ncbi:MAG: hypothetical protein KKC68_06615 [Candidatus Thermoplasmatota archaeon]|nr:hypothetical protein [Candidatus Thermoplasmatota archaeon]
MTKNKKRTDFDKQLDAKCHSTEVYQINKEFLREAEDIYTANDLEALIYIHKNRFKDISALREYRNNQKILSNIHQTYQYKYTNDADYQLERWKNNQEYLENYQEILDAQEVDETTDAVEGIYTESTILDIFQDDDELESSGQIWEEWWKKQNFS